MEKHVNVNQLVQESVMKNQEINILRQENAQMAQRINELEQELRDERAKNNNRSIMPPTVSGRRNYYG
jgi:cell division protein FtsB